MHIRFRTPKIATVAALSCLLLSTEGLGVRMAAGQIVGLNGRVGGGAGQGTGQGTGQGAPGRRPGPDARQPARPCRCPWRRPWPWRSRRTSG